MQFYKPFNGMLTKVVGVDRGVPASLPPYPHFPPLAPRFPPPHPPRPSP